MFNTMWIIWIYFWLSVILHNLCQEVLENWICPLYSFFVWLHCLSGQQSKIWITLHNRTEKTETPSRSARAALSDNSKTIVTYGPIGINTGSFLLGESTPVIYNPEIGDFDRSTRLDRIDTDSHDIFVSTILARSRQ